MVGDHRVSGGLPDCCRSGGREPYLGLATVGHLGQPSRVAQQFQQRQHDLDGDCRRRVCAPVPVWAPAPARCVAGPGGCRIVGTDCCVSRSVAQCAVAAACGCSDGRSAPIPFHAFSSARRRRSICPCGGYLVSIADNPDAIRRTGGQPAQRDDWGKLCHQRWCALAHVPRGFPGNG